MADIVSTLPDAILCHILSFLETKQSVATTILSKRWKYLWRSVPVLDLGRSAVTDQNAYIRFIHFVYSVLLFRDPALPIQKFKLIFGYHIHQIVRPYYPMDTITKWVDFVVQRRVEYIDLHVDLHVGTEYLPKLPISILTCNTLVVLKLVCFNVVELFSPVALPSLKTLHLDNIMFPELRDFMLFLVGCPILEDLSTFDVAFDSEESLTCDEWKSFCLTNLTTADIDCYCNHFPLKAVHNVSSLRLQIDQENCRNDFIHTFHNLTKLDLFCSSLHYNWKMVIEVLKHCPKLQKLHLNEVELEEGLWTRNDDNENWVDPDFVPQCLSLHLRTCYISSFFGLHGTELMLAKYILKNAKVLQTMNIWNSGQPEIKQQLSSSPVASATCKLTVYYVP
ncbi:F-box/FBD/LRR-repeat protein At4g00160-like isoform X2 [Trifolium pratense]|uniref:F-box/FBD/LRR-repeat protein At4g00160-like isoform X1 n=1 Tax=Trifolium pratense TaxID=57577 RepID=UPI001E69733B|nr:F-box/FBD/LRR-repeat protein At4g00160-like isoform X1 [Trifolium pratense]XP_045794311.1 F-box/FBD/LRR-repeat protein At4g00160-like isoform X1 [Trifolium pratense]XP_045794312.1 F-box/FBD/LRR-repeat protein At4g00160-like isoform X2 [Trifolium pratense]